LHLLLKLLVFWGLKLGLALRLLLKLLRLVLNLLQGQKALTRLRLLSNKQRLRGKGSRKPRLKQFNAVKKWLEQVLLPLPLK
jgi:hypothetical protein